MCAANGDYQIEIIEIITWNNIIVFTLFVFDRKNCKLLVFNMSTWSYIFFKIRIGIIVT